MREIKFRGKRIDNGEWVYGSLINNAFFKNADKSACCYILDTDKLEYDCWEDIAEYIDEYEVIPETIGQYTGEVDQNKNEIYEGDFVSGVHTKIKPYGGQREKYFEGVVEWQNGGFSIKLVDQAIINRFGGSTRIFFSPMSVSSLEIKYSIHDKPITTK